MLKVLLVSALFASVASAREEKAHTHGGARLAIALEGKNGKIDFDAPASAIYGFEYVAKSAKDKKSKEQGLKKVEDKIAEMVVFDPSAKCEIKKDMYEVDQKENHADVEFEFRVICEKSPMGTNITVNISKIFPRIKAVKVDVVGDGVQKSLEVKNSGESIELK
ncbi:ZrgA family zinc uptake protein [Bdellovibrio svalbardensis]|uniref:DUF2796 domain-containing protein n=1 Tax=Bdellovibrio svalbardensis TaxID=2972972 RepID=A0ABT6DMR0_9BACT|nr:DUF2796 domain-containing protein [Bdellovibrio svalbardensis]MDG0817899.1 DUF2796 domain-containing protein [Bdellovibrio svalbardensis]